ncbi:helix-turn-helix domain-containing protein [Arthrobacter sp. H20]|uniref:PucR family transcriptional regulator n=1 Tax=Arthrobacter sp. H20 TaxID=1267981 RepID=UPI0004790B0F|nr:helix-turn-helix domain-containing protein [Arthrobacter sp. H20]
MHADGVDAAVEAIAIRLDRGLSLEDLDGVLLAYSSHQSAADRVRVNFLLSKKVPQDVSQWQLQHGISSAVRPVVLPANPLLGMLGRVCVPLLVRGFRVGYLWVQQNVDEASPAAILNLLPGVRSELDRLASLLLEGNTAASEHRRKREGIFLAACDGTAAAFDELAGWAELHNTAPWQVAVLFAQTDLPEPHDPQASLLTHRTAALQATVGERSVLFSAGTPMVAALLVTGDVGSGGYSEILRRYGEEFAKREGGEAGRALVGLSEQFPDLRELPRAFGQARHAVQASAVDSGLGPITNYRSTGCYQFLAAGGWKATSAKSVYFAEIEEQDKNAELLPVLELLYDKNGSVQDVASHLHLHRSSVYNRLARIRSIIGADPLSGHVRLELHLALKARKWSRRPRI